MISKESAITDIPKEDQASRYNEGKIRYDLLEPHAIEELAKVFTKGAEKYAPFNWMKGMPWSKMLASMKRHIASFEKGEDFDAETGLPHMAHAAWNALGLVTYMKYHPQLDDRMHTYIKPKRYALDIDDVLADYVKTWCKLHGQEIPNSWSFDRAIMDKFKTMKEQNTLDEFYLNLPVLTPPNLIPFEPVVYVTSRPVDSKITEAWLDKHGFPAAPVETVGINGNKVEILKQYNVDIFVDDNYKNFTDINASGICCYLYTQPHNTRYNVGHRRINSLMDLKQ